MLPPDWSPRKQLLQVGAVYDPTYLATALWLEWSACTRYLGDAWDPFGSPAGVDIDWPGEDEEQKALHVTVHRQKVCSLAYGALIVLDTTVIAETYDIGDGRRGIVYAAWDDQSPSGDQGIVGIYGLTPWIPVNQRPDPDVLAIDESPLYSFLVRYNKQNPGGKWRLPPYIADFAARHSS